MDPDFSGRPNFRLVDSALVHSVLCLICWSWSLGVGLERAGLGLSLVLGTAGLGLGLGLEGAGFDLGLVTAGLDYNSG